MNWGRILPISGADVPKWGDRLRWIGRIHASRLARWLLLTLNVAAKKITGRQTAMEGILMKKADRLQVSLDGEDLHPVDHDADSRDKMI
jgi:hypothetical protein